MYTKMYSAEKIQGKAHLVPLSLSVQSDYYHGWIHQVTVAVEGEVVVFPGYIQHVPAETQNPRKIISDLNFPVIKLLPVYRINCIYLSSVQ